MTADMERWAVFPVFVLDAGKQDRAIRRMTMSHDMNTARTGLEPLREIGAEPRHGGAAAAALLPKAATPPPAQEAVRPEHGSDAHAMRADAVLLPQVLAYLQEGVCFVDLQNQIRSWNKGAEAITGYRKEEVIGHSCCDRVFMHAAAGGSGECQGDCPSRSVLASGSPRELEMFLLHRAGHRVPVSLRVAPLRGVAGSVIGSLHIFAERRHTLAAIEHARDFERFTFIDPLTGMGNRRYTEIALGQAFEAFMRYGRRPALIIFDVDRLEAVNATYGRDAGDQVLRSITRTIGSCLRSYDFLGRWAEDEFFAVLADTHSDHLAALAEECRSQVASSSILLGAHAVQASLSMGTSLLIPNDTPESWLARAERNLREAKLEGGDRIMGDPVNTLFNWFQPNPSGD